MTVLPIIRPDNPTLRRKARRVIAFDQKLQALVDDMVETLLDAPGVGLAAPQVEVSRRLIIVRLPDDEASKEEYGKDAGRLYVVANPEIVKASKEMVEGIEACLSIPGFYGAVDRYESVVITGQDAQGKPQRIKAKGWLARVFQHEIDHLDGRLYIDIAKQVWEAGQDDENEAEVESTGDTAAQIE